MTTVRNTGYRARAALIATIVSALAISTAGTATAATSGGWSNLGQGATAGSSALNGNVYAMTRSGTDLYLGGNFTDAGAVSAADRVARWTGSAWAAVGAGITNGQVNAIAVDGPRVFVGGAFSDAGGVTDADHLAVWNGSTWEPVGGQKPGGEVHSFAIIGRKLFVAGTFSNAAGIADADGIAVYDLDTGVWSAITESGEFGAVYAIAPDGAGGLYAGGFFIDGGGADGADHLSHWTGGTTWSVVGSIEALNGAVRGMTVSGSNLYVVGDFINAAGIAAADKVARFDGTWHSLGSSSAFGESNLSLFDVVANGSAVFVVGGFANAAGIAQADNVAGFIGGSWDNVGSNADGTNGPTGGTLYTAAIVGARLYVGGNAVSIGGSSQNNGAAFARLQQPDARIKTTGAFVGNGIYNANGNSQTRTRSANQGATATFTVVIENDGVVTDSLTVLGAGSGGGFKVTYLMGSVDVTSAVIAGNLAMPGLAPGASRTITVKVKVGNGVANGATRSFLVTATSTTTGTARDAVKAKVKAT